jgi:putative lipoprotein
MRFTLPVALMALALGAAGPGLLLMGCAAGPSATTAARGSAEIAGEVFYRERVLLPEDAVLHVRLLESAGGDSPAVTLASATIDPAGQVPIPFALQYDPSRLADGREHTLDARITVGDQLVFVNGSAVPLATASGPEPLRILLVNARGRDAQP